MNTGQRLDGVADHSSLRVISIDPQSDPRWGTLMNRLSTSVIYQHPAWLGVLGEAYGYTPIHLACEDTTGELRGILPLFYRRGLRTGRLCASLFDSPIAGPLAYDDQARAALIQAATERTRAERGAEFQLKVMSTSLDGLVDDVSGVPLFETYELALPERLDLLHLNPKIKWAANKASKLDVQIRLAETISDLRAWYVLYIQTMRRLVAVPKPYRFFQLAWQRLHPQGLLRLLLAEQVQAGQCQLISGFLFCSGVRRFPISSPDGEGRIRDCDRTISCTGTQFGLPVLSVCAGTTLQCPRGRSRAGPIQKQVGC